MLAIRGPEASLDWPLARIAVRADPGGAAVLSLGKDPARLVIDDPATQDMLRGHVRRWPRPGMGWRAALAACAAVVMLMVVFVDQAPRLLAPLVPAAWEDAAGYGAEAALTAGHSVCTGAAGQAALDRLVALLSAGRIQAPVRTLVLDDGLVNAFTLPGHRLLLMRGLIATSSDGDELAGVIGHELGHVQNRDPARQLIRQLGLGIIGAALGWGSVDLGGMAGTLLGLSYGRSAETAADAVAIEALQGAGLRADGLARFFARIDRADDGATFLSSHPASAERRRLTQQPATGAPAFTPAEWDAIKTMCAK